MPNHGNINQDLNGGSLSIKGKRILDSDRNLKVNTLKTNGVTFVNKESITSGAFYNEVEDTDATLNALAGFVTTPTASAGTDASFNINLTNSYVTANSIVFAQVTTYSGSGVPIVARVSVATGIATIIVQNVGTTGLDAAVTVGFFVM